MLHPSYSDLIEVANSGVEEGEHPVVNSRYSIVIATAKRARQIIAGAEPLIDNARGKKPGEDEEMNEEIVAEADDADEEAIEETVE